jgi:hypothetical protein
VPNPSAKPYFVREDTGQARVFGKNGREVFLVKIRSNAEPLVKDCFIVARGTRSINVR